MREYIDHYVTNGSHREKLAFVFEQIERLRDQRAPLRRLELLVYVFEALKLHLDDGGLRAGATNALFEMAERILRELATPTRRVGHIEAELRLLRARLHEVDGKPWDAAWEMALAAQAAARSLETTVESWQLGSARTALRLGQARHALNLLANTPMGGEAAARGALLKSTAWRWLGRPDAARAALADSAAAATGDIAEARDWEAMRIDAAEGRDPFGLCVAIRKRNPHRQPERILEAYLSVWSSPSAKALEDAPKLATLARERPLGLHRAGFLHQAAQVLETCYDSKTSLAARLRGVTEVLARAGEARTLDHECLLLTAAARWLSRIRMFDLAALVLGRYRGLALAASGGVSEDPLGVATDLLARPWFLAAAGELVLDLGEDVPA